MGFSAFLSLPMAKEKENFKLKTVDEEAEKVPRFVRLHRDEVDEEVEELPPVRVGERELPGAFAPGVVREDFKTRSNEPDVGALIETTNTVEPDELWGQVSAGFGKLPWGWAALLGCAFVGAVLWSLYAVNRADKKLEMIVDTSVSIIEKDIQDETDAVAMVTKIEAAAQGFFDSRSVEEMLRYVRHPERVAPLMEKHYGKTAPTPIRIVRILSLSPLTMENRASFWMVSCELKDVETRQLLIEADSESEAKVDWETYVCYQPMDWDEFVKTRPGGYTGDFRVYAEADNYYSHEFHDSNTFVSFRLTALNAEEVLNGYAVRGSDAAESIGGLIAKNGGGVVPMILRLHLPEGLGSKRGIVIKQLVSPRWVFLDNPDGVAN